MFRALKEAGILLNLAQAAAACGEAKLSTDLLKEACRAGIESIESFNAAANVAQDINATELLDQIVTEMRVAYPHHPMTVAHSFNHLMGRSQYREAADLALAVNASFRIGVGMLVRRRRHSGTPS